MIDPVLGANLCMQPRITNSPAWQSMVWSVGCWRHHLQIDDSPQWESKAWFLHGNWCHWCHFQTWDTGLIHMGWCPQIFDFSKYHMPLAQKDGVVVWEISKWNVHGWPWTWEHCRVLASIHQMIQKLRTSISHLGQCGKWTPSPFRLPCAQSNWVLPPFSYHSQWIDLLPKWPMTDSLGMSWWWCSNIKGRRHFPHDLGFFDFGVGLFMGQKQVHFCWPFPLISLTASQWSSGYFPTWEEPGQMVHCQQFAHPGQPCNRHLWGAHQRICPGHLPLW